MTKDEMVNAMTPKEWMKKNEWYIDAIRNQETVLLSDDGVTWMEWAPIGFNAHPAARSRYLSPGGMFMYAKPKPKTERRYLTPVKMMQWLVDHGYYPNSKGCWISTNGESLTFTPEMWKYCGSRVEPHDALDWIWRPEWIEEVEVE